MRLWDPGPLLESYRQLQVIRLYYDFNDVDVDRYDVKGVRRQVMLGARDRWWDAHAILARAFER